VPEVKSILSTKVITAQQQRLQMSVDIPHKIEIIAMPVIDFIRIISILFDNAIEEAVHSKEKTVQFAFFEMDDSQYIVVQNSCEQEEINIEKIYDKAYSRKSVGRGYGLFSLKTLINKVDHVTLETSFQAPYFSQTLIIKKESSN